MNRPHLVVDVDDPKTWPDVLTERISSLAERVQEQTGGPGLFCSDLPLWEDEADIRQLLRGHLLRAYHATRLLPHEVESIRTQGMRVLNEELTRDRLTVAWHHGHITNDDHRMLASKTTLTDNRTKKICLFLSSHTMTRDARGLDLLLSYWGGEGIYWEHVHRENPLRETLRSFGTPTVVVATIDLAAARRLHIFPGIANAFVGAMLGLDDVGSDIHYYAPIPPGHIERFIQPGDPLYSQHPELPQE